MVTAPVVTTSDVGLPEIVELRHASAEELAEQLNALLAKDGTLAQLPRQETGLSASSATESSSRRFRCEATSPT